MKLSGGIYADSLGAKCHFETKQTLLNCLFSFCVHVSAGGGGGVSR